MSENRIDRAFADLRTAGRKGLIPFLAAGDPSLDTTEQLVLEFAAQGADIIELGVPFSDPLADGVVNQRAYQRALAAGVTLPRILETVKRIRTRSDVPVVLMSYLNPIHRYGLKAFPTAARDAGVDGLIISDCPPEEMAEFQSNLEQAGVHAVLLLAPTSSAERIRRISAHAGGYLYYVSLRGVTGTRDALPPDLAEGIGRIRQVTKKPLAVGFGISTPEQASAVAKLADAVIVGSAIVARIESALNKPDLVLSVGAFVQTLRTAIG
jgi:tryptophan synthase alpha chain